MPTAKLLSNILIVTTRRCRSLQETKNGCTTIWLWSCKCALMSLHRWIINCKGSGLNLPKILSGMRWRFLWIRNSQMKFDMMCDTQLGFAQGGGREANQASDKVEVSKRTNYALVVRHPVPPFLFFLGADTEKVASSFSSPYSCFIPIQCISWDHLVIYDHMQQQQQQQRKRAGGWNKGQAIMHTFAAWLIFTSSVPHGADVNTFHVFCFSQQRGKGSVLRSINRTVQKTMLFWHGLQYFISSKWKEKEKSLTIHSNQENLLNAFHLFFFFTYTCVSHYYYTDMLKLRYILYNYRFCVCFCGRLFIIS